MKALNPVIAVPCGALELRALEAGRGAKEGLLATVQVCRGGDSIAVVMVAFAQPLSRSALKTEIARAIDEAPPDLDAALLDLHAQVEVALRTKPEKLTARELSGGAITFDEPEPCEEPVEGGAILDAIVAVLHRFVVFPQEASWAVALWVMAAWGFDHFDIFPRLAFRSPVMRCGKTVLLRIVGLLVPKPLKASNASSSTIFRTVEDHRPSLLIDEADSFLPGNEELRGILDSGHERDGGVLRNVRVGDDFKTRRFSTFSPVVLALIGPLAATLADRSIVIEMKRKRREDVVERLNRRKVDAELQPLRRQMVRWSRDHAESLEAPGPEAPRELNDRQADNWEPLLAIADLSGGEWPVRAQKAARALSLFDEKDDGDLGLRLLADMKSLFSKDKEGGETSWLLGALKGIEDAPWQDLNNGKGLTAHRLSRLLLRFGVKPTRWKEGGIDHRGYIRRGTLQEAFDLYVPPPPPPPGDKSDAPTPDKSTPEKHVGISASDGSDATREGIKTDAENPLQNPLVGARGVEASVPSLTGKPEGPLGWGLDPGAEYQEAREWSTSHATPIWSELVQAQDALRASLRGSRDGPEGRTRCFERFRDAVVAVRRAHAGRGDGGHPTGGIA